jgi:hypothetical protein
MITGPYADAGLKLYDYVLNTHWTGKSLMGPDPGLRFHSRIWRFLKSYTRFIPWKDDQYFLQCQGYWIWNNWKLYDLYQESRYSEVASACTETILESQEDGGYWEYPLSQWRGRVATVEGNYAALGLLETYKHTHDQSLLDAVLRWYACLIDKIGFQSYEDSLAINYFAGMDGRLVPNNTTLTLELLAKIYRLTKDKKYLRYCKEMIRFLGYSQRETGELPYAFETPWMAGREHFLCYQYNAFQFLDLVEYWEITKDDRVYSILKNLHRFLRTGFYAKGHSKYNCYKAYPEVTYYTAVLGAAFGKAAQIGLDDLSEYEEKLYRRVLLRQNKKGGFIYSSRNYHILSDRRSYPRYLAMILKHLLMKVEKDRNESIE